MAKIKTNLKGYFLGSPVNKFTGAQQKIIEEIVKVVNINADNGNSPTGGAEGYINYLLCDTESGVISVPTSPILYGSLESELQIATSLEFPDLVIFAGCEMELENVNNTTELPTATLDFPVLEEIHVASNDVEIYGFGQGLAGTSIGFPKLNKILYLGVDDGEIGFGESLYTELNFPALTLIESVFGAKYITIESNSVLTDINFSALLKTDFPSGVQENYGEIKVSDNPELRNINFPLFTGDLDSDVFYLSVNFQNLLLENIALPQLVRGLGLIIDGANAMGVLDLPKMEHTDWIQFTGGNISGLSVPLLTSAREIEITSNNKVVALEFPVLDTVTGNLRLRFNDNLATVDVSAIENMSAGQLRISENPLLTSIDLNANIDCVDLDFSFNALTVASVDSILALIDAKGEINGTLKLEGSAMGIPTGDGDNPNIVSLQGKGWTVTYYD